MDIGQVTVKEILEKQVGEEKTARILKAINEAYQQGKRGKDLLEQFKDVVSGEGLDPDGAQFQFVANNVLPNPY